MSERDTANEAIYFESVGLLGGPDEGEQNALTDAPSAFADEEGAAPCARCGQPSDSWPGEGATWLCQECWEAYCDRTWWAAIQAITAR